MALEMLVLTVVLAANVGLALKARRLPSGGRRKSLVLFAAFHTGFFATIVGLLILGWLLIQSGKTNQEIADQLFISLATVKDHNHNIFRKCGVRNRLELSNLFR
jgi:hypothetical protein